MNGYGTYLRNQNTIQSPRDVEYRLLAQVTAALIEADANPQLYGKRAEAITWNRRVWSTFRMDLIDDSNGLPRELRASLVSLAIWVERETFTLLQNRGGLAPLITVNKHIMEGLRPSTAAPQSQLSGDDNGRAIAQAS